MTTTSQILSPQEVKGLQNKEIQKIIESVQQSLEEKIAQMSQIRLVAEVMSSGLYRSSYIQNVCEDLTESFNALASCYLKFCQSDSPGWKLETI